MNQSEQEWPASECWGAIFASVLLALIAAGVIWAGQYVKTAILVLDGGQQLGGTFRYIGFHADEQKSGGEQKP